VAKAGRPRLACRLLPVRRRLEQLSAARVACDTILPETEKSMRAATRQLTMLANALALTPSQRQRLFVNKAEEAPPAVDDVWAQLRRFPRIGPA
jgi:hypothetical protein